MAPPDEPDDSDAKPDAGSSQSIDIQFSAHQLPRAELPPVERRKRARTMPGMLVESLSTIPVVKEVIPKTRRGRVLARSVIVGFALVATWIGVIVYWQLRGGEKPDFRPQIEQTLVAMRDGHADWVYQHASTRFQEMVLESTFVTEVEDMNDSLGPFREVASVVDTRVFRGPSGKTARVQLLLEFEEGRVRASMSFLYEEGQWRMIGFDLELPSEVAKAHGRLPDPAPPDITVLTQHILELSRDNKPGEIWEGADQVFKLSISKKAFEDLEKETREQIGPFLRMLKVSNTSMDPGGKSASLDALLEFNAPTGTTVTIDGKFKYKLSNGTWKLTFYKLIMPMPHVGGTAPAPP